VTPDTFRSSLLARTLVSAMPWLAVLGAIGCGDGKDVFLGTKRDLPPAPDGGPEAGADGGTDSMSACANGDPIPLPLLALLEGSGEPSGRDLVGFGRGATGGKDGCLYIVTEFTDDIPGRPGTLRFALESPDALWIAFERPGEIELKDNLRPLSNKTIDGRNARVTLRNYGIDIAGHENLVIANLEFIGDPYVDAAPQADDGVTLRQRSSRVWIDHCTFSDYGDGLIDVTEGATDITISWSHFKPSQFDLEQKVMLLGSEDDTEDMGRSEMRVTLHHNWFDHTYTYHPRMRWGRVHTFNNLLDEWGDYGAGAGDESRLYSERNVYLSGRDTTGGSTEAIETDFSDQGDEVPALVWSEQDSFLGGADPHQNQGTPEQVFVPSTEYPYTPSPVADVRTDVPAGAGVR
jgi:pectate lyase